MSFKAGIGVVTCRRRDVPNDIIGQVRALRPFRTATERAMTRRLSQRP